MATIWKNHAGNKFKEEEKKQKALKEVLNKYIWYAKSDIHGTDA